MKVQTASALFFAALATAYNPHGHGQRFHHRRFANESTALTAAQTTTAEAALTTLTVQTTLTSTVFDCGKGNTTTCDGAHATGVITVTEVVDLTTTVCPLTDVESIKSSVIASASQTAPVVVEATQTVIPVKEEDLVKPTPSPSDDLVLSYTLGTGSSQSVVVTTIKNTKTAYDYTTKFITYDNSPHTQTLVGVVPEETTTLSSTITSTRYVTVPYVKPTGTPSTGTNEETVDENSPIDDSDDEECPPAVTVTVAATTIYETVTYTPPAAGAPTPSPVESVTDNDNVGGNPDETKPDGTPTTDCPEDEATAAPEESVEDNDNLEASPTTDCPEDEATAAPVVEDEEEPVIEMSTIYVIPTKYENTTIPRPTGFITKARDTGSVILPAPTGGAY